MEKQLPPSPGHGVPEVFLDKFGHQITGCLSGFDRLRFQGTLRLLYKPNSMEAYLATCGVLIKHFKNFAERITHRIKALAFKTTEEQGRPVQYLNKNMHSDFGLMHVRVQSWFPFAVQVCLDGRESLARQMDAAGI